MPKFPDPRTHNDRAATISTNRWCGREDGRRRRGRWAVGSSNSNRSDHLPLILKPERMGGGSEIIDGVVKCMRKTNQNCMARVDMSGLIAGCEPSSVEGEIVRSSLVSCGSNVKASSILRISLIAGSVDSGCGSYAIDGILGRKMGVRFAIVDGEDMCGFVCAWESARSQLSYSWVGTEIRCRGRYLLVVELRRVLVALLIAALGSISGCRFTRCSLNT